MNIIKKFLIWYHTKKIYSMETWAMLYRPSPSYYETSWEAHRKEDCRLSYLIKRDYHAEKLNQLLNEKI